MAPSKVACRSSLEPDQSTCLANVTFDAMTPFSNVQKWQTKACLTVSRPRRSIAFGNRAWSATTGPRVKQSTTSLLVMRALFGVQLRALAGLEPASAVKPRTIAATLTAQIFNCPPAQPPELTAPRSQGA